MSQANRHSTRALRLMVGVALARGLAFLVLAGVAVRATAQDTIHYAVDTKASKLVAVVPFFGFATKSAQFPDLSGGFAISPSDMSRADVTVDIDARTLTTGDAATGLLRGGSFFDAAHYPRIHFAGHHLTLTGDRSGRVDGTMTVRGVTRPLSLDLTFSEPPIATGGTRPIELVGTATVDRYAFGMKAFPFLVGRQVKVTIRARIVPG